ncbi:MAG: isoprenylcysteine carboxylmethyltransferase family protein [Porticoccaceae bacterium]
MPDSLDFILRFLIFAAVHSLLAIPRLKQRLQELTGLKTHWYRLIYNALSLVLFGWVMLAWPSTRVIYLVPGIWNLVMQGLQGLSLVGMLICLRQTGLGKFLGFTPESTEQDTLTTSGCHAVVRHPLYLLGLIFFLFNPVMTTRWLTLTFIGTAYIIAGGLIEERRLLRQFGTAYARYQQNVPFLLPRLRPTVPSAD